MRIARKINKGAVSILLVMGLSILILLIVISITSVETARLYLVQANVDSSQAHEYAEGGVRDALMQLSRNNTFGTSTRDYQIEMIEGGCVSLTGCAKVSVSPTILASSSTGRIIGSLGYYKSARRGIEAIVSFDEFDLGELKIIETKETLSPFGL